MISGEFVDGKVIIPVRFCMEKSISDLTINFVIDTGFNNCLTLPMQAITAMGLPFHSTTVAKLADGSKSLIETYLARVVWDDKKELVTVLSTNGKPLLGTALLQGFRLTAEFIDGGIVKIERI
jgi:clan AA aspartic protease